MPSPRCDSVHRDGPCEERSCIGSKPGSPWAPGLSTSQERGRIGDFTAQSASISRTLSATEPTVTHFDQVG